MDYAFLPYLSPWERLLLALVLPQGIYQSSRWYLDLLYDPVGFLMEQGVKKVILLTSRGSGRTGRPLQYDPVNIEGLPGYHVYLKGLEPLDETMERSILSEEDSSWKDYRTDGRLWIGVPTPNSNEVRGPVLWEFVLYCVPMSENEIACFREWVAKQPSVRLVLGQRGDTALALLSDPFLLQKLRKRYSKLLPKGENLNFTSLLLWHAPLMENISAMEAGHCLDYGGIHGSLYKTLVECCPQDTWCAFLKLLGWENKLGQFLLGDLNYRQLVKDGGMYNQFRQHFGDRLNATMVCLLPHHGSRRNWDRQILEDMGSAKFWVASAERRRGGYPPHWEVIADITSAGRSFVWVGGTTSGNVSCDTCTNTPQDTDYVVVFTF
ncbi:hypothetical protein TAMC210_07660 [Thermanaeromonas sp. C210]|nr:hypothetical protein TAMC210_07660 [Thermanaeromonas sp. C210]